MDTLNLCLKVYIVKTFTKVCVEKQKLEKEQIIRGSELIEGMCLCNLLELCKLVLTRAD